MAELVVRNLEDDVKARLQHRARRHGHSTEEEVRAILRNAVRDEEDGRREPLGSRLRARFVGRGLENEIEELRGGSPDRQPSRNDRSRYERHLRCHATASPTRLTTRASPPLALIRAP